MKTTNEHIAKFLEQLELKDYDKFNVLCTLRAIVFEAFPNVNETFKYGGIMFSSNDEFGGLFVYKNHISFEFSYGYKLTTSLTLEGGGKYRRHLKFKNLPDTDKRELKALLKQVKTIDEK